MTSNLRARACLRLVVSVGLVASVVVGVAPSAGATSPSWSIVPSPSPSPAPRLGNTLDAVSCVTATDCFAVGDTDTYIRGAGVKTLVERWDGTSWSVVASPNSATAVGSELNGVSCVARRSASRSATPTPTPTGLMAGLRPRRWWSSGMASVGRSSRTPIRSSARAVPRSKRCRARSRRAARGWLLRHASHQGLHRRSHVGGAMGRDKPVDRPKPQRRQPTEAVRAERLVERFVPDRSVLRRGRPGVQHLR